jgi:AraC family transcriptional regulator
VGILKNRKTAVSISPTEYGRAQTSLLLHKDVSLLKSSDGLGWTDIYAALTDERPHEAIHRPIPDIWLATTFSGVNLKRASGGRLHHDTLPANLVSITAPGETVQDFIGATTTALHVYLKADVLREVANELFPAHRADREIIPVFAANDRFLVSFLRVIKDALAEDPASNVLKMEYLSRALAAHILQAHSSPGMAKVAGEESKLSARQLRLVLDYVEENLGNEISIADLASLIGLKRVQFMRRFKSSMRMTAYQYVMQARIRLAQNLLRGRALEIAEIALICGFASQAHFSSVFKSLVTMSPAQYRRITV